MSPDRCPRGSRGSMSTSRVPCTVPSPPVRTCWCSTYGPSWRISSAVVGWDLALYCRQFRIEYPVPRADVASLAAQVFGAIPEIVAVELSGTFSGVTVPNGTFGRADGTAVGFVTHTSPPRDWHLSFLTT